MTTLEEPPGGTGDPFEGGEGSPTEGPHELTPEHLKRAQEGPHVEAVEPLHGDVIHEHRPPA